jgi:hypothetical protein
MRRPPSHLVLFISALTEEFIFLPDRTSGFMLGNKTHEKLRRLEL